MLPSPFYFIAMSCWPNNFRHMKLRGDEILEGKYSRKQGVEAGSFKQNWLVMAVHTNLMLKMLLGHSKCLFLSVCRQRVSHLHLPAGRVSGKTPLRIIKDPSEHNFCNYRCSVIMLMLIHKELLFAQRVLCTLSPYLTNCVFAQQLWFACHVKWCLHLGACHGTRRSAEVLVHPHQKVFWWLHDDEKGKGNMWRESGKENLHLTEGEIVVQGWSEGHRESRLRFVTLPFWFHIWPLVLRKVKSLPGLLFQGFGWLELVESHFQSLFQLVRALRDHLRH